MKALASLPDAPQESRPCLYACENDHTMVETLAKLLAEKVVVVNCMVDRICTERSIEPDWVGVGTEPHAGELVVMNDPRNGVLPPFVGKNVQVPSLPAQAEYFCQRKIIMVNGMHTTLAFMTLCKNIPEPAGLLDNSWKDFSLITHQVATEEERRLIHVWTTARCLFILWEFDVQLIMAAHGVETEDEAVDILLAYAKTTIKRFDTVKDKAGRVLGGGVAKRYDGRLKMIMDWLDGEPPMRRGIRRRLIDRAGVSEAELRSKVKDMVSSAKRFGGVVVRKASKAKIVVT
ncbi:unnamed protein product [Chrysoparadoxa australica]